MGYKKILLFVLAATIVFAQDFCVESTNGNVGIGTDTPDAKLEVLDASGGPQLRLTKTDSTDFVDFTVGDGLLIEATSAGDEIIMGSEVEFEESARALLFLLRRDIPDNDAWALTLQLVGPDEHLQIRNTVGSTCVDYNQDCTAIHSGRETFNDGISFGNGIDIFRAGDDLLIENSNSATGDVEVSLNSGEFRVSGGTKNFVQPHPTDPTKEIDYSTLEGPEAGTYIRGTANCVNKQSTIVFPEHFPLVTNEQGLTAQLTSRGKQNVFFIKELTNKKLVVGCSDDGAFDYLVNGIRTGYENFQVIRDKK